mgnify:CR=1 FL=1
MHGLVGKAFFALIAALWAIKITKSISSGSRGKQAVIVNALLNVKIPKKPYMALACVDMTVLFYISYV